MAEFTKALNCDRGGIHFEELGRPAATVGTTVDFDLHYVRQYEQYYASKNGWLRERIPHQAGSLLLSREVYPEQKLVKTEYFNDWLYPQNLFYALGPIIGRKSQTPAHPTLFRSKQAGPFTESERNLSLALVPHLEGAFQRHSRIAELEMHKTASFRFPARLNGASFQ